MLPIHTLIILQITLINPQEQLLTHQTYQTMYIDLHKILLPTLRTKDHTTQRQFETQKDTTTILSPTAQPHSH